MIADLACGLAQIYDQIYYENFESDKREQEERARAEAERAQAAAWAAGGPHSGPPGFEGAPRQHPLLTHHVSACCIATPFLPDRLCFAHCCAWAVSAQILARPVSACCTVSLFLLGYLTYSCDATASVGQEALQRDGGNGIVGLPSCLESLGGISEIA